MTNQNGNERTPKRGFLTRVFRGPLPAAEKYGITNSDGYTILDTEKLKRSPKFQKLQKEVEEFQIDPRFLNNSNGFRNGNHPQDSK
jgi:hypothetical protein